MLRTKQSILDPSKEIVPTFMTFWRWVSRLWSISKEIPKSQDIVACCRGPYCVYSYEAIEILRPKGFRARRLDGGFSEWLAAGLPIERPRAPNRN